jgi:hypothetical protein
VWGSIPWRAVAILEIANQDVAGVMLHSGKAVKLASSFSEANWTFVW